MSFISESKPLSYLAGYAPGASAGFEQIRNAALAAGPLDARTCEMVLIVGFLLIDNEEGFKSHSRRELAAGVPPEALRQAVILLLAAVTSLSRVTSGLRWIDEIVQSGADDHPV